MKTVLLRGDPLNVGGTFPMLGQKAHSFMLVRTNMEDVPLSSYGPCHKILAVLPSIDTRIGLRIARHFEDNARAYPQTAILIISVDTPFALARMIAAEGFRHVELLSTVRGRDFHKDYGVMITDPPLSGLMATALFLLDGQDTIRYAELVPDFDEEPDYSALDLTFHAVVTESRPISPPVSTTPLSYRA